MIDFNSFIDAFLEREAKPRQLHRFWPSEAGLCLRRTWYSFKEPRQADAGALRVFHAGNILHGFVVDVFKSEKTKGVKLLATEQPFQLKRGNIIVSGRVDDVIIIEEGHRRAVVEVKSTSSLEYTKEANDSHVLQLQLYLNATGIKDGAVLYIEKNTLQAKVFPVKYDENLAELAFARFQAVDEALTANKIPAPEAKQKNEMKWQCRFCPWKTECDNECGAEK
ncbi:MAG: PD-(D/E)XK nuclease family protein [Candidatus Micrarchaeia archaeon]